MVEYKVGDKVKASSYHDGPMWIGTITYIDYSGNIKVVFDNKDRQWYSGYSVSSRKCLELLARPKDVFQVIKDA